MDRLFDTYAELLPVLVDHFREHDPEGATPTPTSSTARPSGPRRSTPLRGILPAASLSNVGIYGTGQGYEALLLRMRAHPLPEARDYADLMLTELRKVIPSFLKRVDLADRGVAWSDYFGDSHQAMAEVAARLFPAGTDVDAAPVGHPRSTSTPTPRTSWSPAPCYSHLNLPETRSMDRVRAHAAPTTAWPCCGPTWGSGRNRRHKPGRALERTDYRFDVLADYGAFRDLQRHRMLTIEWQQLTPAPRLHPARGRRATPAPATASTRPWTRSAALYDDARPSRSRSRPSYAVALAYRVRFVMQMNAREAMHLIELRTTPQGHPAYRLVGQEMHRLIAEQAGHPAIAEMMRFVDHSAEPELERLEAERRAEERRRLGR